MVNKYSYLIYAVLMLHVHVILIFLFVLLLYTVHFSYIDWWFYSPVNQLTFKVNCKKMMADEKGILEYNCTLVLKIWNSQLKYWNKPVNLPAFCQTINWEVSKVMKWLINRALVRILQEVCLSRSWDVN